MADMDAKAEKLRIGRLKDLIIQLFPRSRDTPSCLANSLGNFITQSKHIEVHVAIELDVMSLVLWCNQCTGAPDGSFFFNLPKIA